MKIKFTHKLWLSLALFIAPGSPVIAEVVLDGTLGASGSVAGPNYDITQGLGKTVGQNLFHSFSQFNLSNTESATFSGDATVNNVISRVTGGDASTINGLVRSTIPGADFFFINPAGVVLGNDASIDVGGSFNVGTAEYISLDGIGRFDAINPAASTLTIDPPTAFGFYAGPPASIDIGDALLQTKTSQRLSVIGGDITITDGNLYAPGGQVVLASVASAGEVSLDPDAMSLDGFQSLGTINISNPSGSFPFIGVGRVGNVDVTTASPGSAGGGGRILISGGNLFIDEGRLRADVFENTEGGGIDIKTRDMVAFSGDTRVSANTRFFGGKSGPITIQAGTLVMSGDAFINSNTQGAGDGGTVSIEVENVLLQDQTEISADAQQGGVGGNVQVIGNSLEMSGDSRIKTSTFGGSASGDAGTVLIQVNDVLMSGDATINSSSESGSQGQAGTVTVSASSLQMQDEAWIISFTETDQNAGSITVNADDMTMSDQSVISTSTFSSGDGGTIIVNASSLVMADAAIITSGTEGTGTAGNVIINIGSLALKDGAILSSESEGGNFFVRGGVDLGDATGGGDGGAVMVNANSVTLNGGSLISSGTGGAGSGGDVELAVTNLGVLGGSSISAVSSGTGTAGNISVDAVNAIQLTGGSITTETLDADGGNISLTATQLVYLLDSAISTSVQGGLGNGGNITIDPVFVVLNNSTIIANAFGGDGGNILIVAENYFQDQSSVIEASSSLGIDGTITIKSPDETVSSSLSEMPEALLTVTQLASQQCDVKTRKDISSLVMVGRDGLPPSTDDFVALRIPLVTGSNGSKVANHPDEPGYYPAIQLGKHYKPGELVVLDCSHS